MKETYAKRVYRENRKQLLVTFLIAVFVSLVSFCYALFNLARFKIPSVAIGAITLTLFSLISILAREIYIRIDQYGNELSKNIENSKRGIEGEDSAKDLILETIGEGCKVYFNKDLPTGGDIDCLILGKKGLILIEIKNFSKQVRLPLFWVRGFNDPRNEAKRHATSLTRYFAENDYHKPIRIRKAVLYINKTVTYWGEQEVFNIRGLDRFASYFFGLPLDSVITDQDIAEISSLIEKLK